MCRGCRILFFACLVAMLAGADTSVAQPENATAPGRDPEAEALAGFDETTGLWFPPDAPRDVYLEGSDPAHNLVRDWQRIFRADPELRKAVLRLLKDPRRQVNTSNLPENIRQRRTQLSMMCVGSELGQQARAADDARWQDRERQFETWMNVAGARALGDEQRLARMQEISASIYASTDGEERLRLAFEMLGAAPQADEPYYWLLTVDPVQVRLRPKYTAFLRSLLDRESAPGMPEASRYRMGLASFFFYRGEVREARALVRQEVEDPVLGRWTASNRSFLALLDELSGDRGAISRVASTCEVPERFRDEYRDRPPGAYCYEVVAAVAGRCLEVLGEKAPPGLTDALADAVAKEPSNWLRRTTGISTLAKLEPTRARRQADEMLQVPATLVPLEFRLDAIAVVGSTSLRLRDFSRAIAAWDFFLASLGYRPTPISPNVWTRLTALPDEVTGKLVGDNRTPGLDVLWALGRRFETYVQAGDYPQARRALEEYLATSFLYLDTLEAGKKRISDLVTTAGLDPAQVKDLRKLLDESAAATAFTARSWVRGTRHSLGELGAACLKAGKTPEASRMVAYLSAQPGPEGASIPTALYPLYWGRKNKGEAVAPASTPWDRSAPPPRPPPATRQR